MTANQIHSADVRTLRDAEDARAEPSACDALTAKLPRVLLSVQTADCLPILLVDQRTRAYATVHAGWRGSLTRIVSRTLERMQQSYGTQPGDVLAAFGPAIAACCFEVGPEVVEQFEREFAFGPVLVTNRQANGKAHLNLGLLNRQLLLEAGVAADHLFDCELCTVCRNDLFFSYRRERGAEQAIGRSMGVVGWEV